VKRYKYSTLANIVKKFNKKRLMVIGDLLLDKIVRGEVSRISPEAPVPVVWVKSDDEYVPGGSCNVARNLANLGVEVLLVGVVGEDDNSGKLKDILDEENICTEGIVRSNDGRPTILKTRIFAGRGLSQQVLRIDRENIDTVKGDTLRKVISFIKKNIESVDGVIIEDYGKGLVTPQLIKTVVSLSKKYGKIVAVDPKEDHFPYYKGVSVITPNHHEAEKAVGFPFYDSKALKKAGQKLLRDSKAEAILITLGEEGMMVFNKKKPPKKIPTIAQEVSDVSGAGDTVIALYALSVISGASSIIAAHIANCAAGIVVGKAGPAAVGKKELMERLKKETGRSR